MAQSERIPRLRDGDYGDSCNALHGALALAKQRLVTALYDQPRIDKSRVRVTGPFTVEAVPAPVVEPLAAAGEGEGWARLARSLRAELDEERIEAYRGTVSLPFEAKRGQRLAVKLVDDRGIESLRILEVE